MTPTLHELANLPGAGKAMDTLIRNGAVLAEWEGRPVWTVPVVVIISGYTEISVAADDEESAGILAKNYAERNSDDLDLDDVSVSANAEKAKRAPGSARGVGRPDVIGAAE